METKLQQRSREYKDQLKIMFIFYLKIYFLRNIFLADTFIALGEGDAQELLVGLAVWEWCWPCRCTGPSSTCSCG